MRIVPPYGPTPSPVLLCGEAPGREEWARKRPFIGKSGRAQEEYLFRHGLSTRGWRLTNVIAEFTDGNPDPTPSQIAHWTPILLREIEHTRPRLIIAVGRFAMRWFLGERAELEICHGRPYRAGAYDPSRADRGGAGKRAAIILPIIHPAAGLRDDPESIARRALIAWDYAQIAHYLRLIRQGREHEIECVRDEYAGQEEYIDCTGAQLESDLDLVGPDEIAIDTEGWPKREWSIQPSFAPGTAYVLRTSQPDFARGIKALQRHVDKGKLIITHDASTPLGCLHDTIISRGVGLELSHARHWNAMYAAYLLRVERLALKILMQRWCGMDGEDYESLVGDVGKEKQLEWLLQILDRASEWTIPERREVRENDGTISLYKPQSAVQAAKRIIDDVLAGKVTKEGPTDPYKRWRKVDVVVRREVERALGRMPSGTMDDIPLDRAIHYSARDSDATLRLKHKLEPELARMGLLPLFATGMQVLPIFEEMQRHGMPASRREFLSLTEHVSAEMIALQSRISRDYWFGRPFNPGSDDQVRKLIKRYGLEAEKTTPTGLVSVAKKSIEHHREEHEVIDLIFKYKERSKVLGTYCKPIVEIADEAAGVAGEDIDPTYPDLFFVHGKIKPATVETRRLSMEKPSLLNQPTRTELGRRVRACYSYPADMDMVMGAWDFSGQEMRVAAHVSQDPLLCDLFRTCRWCGQSLMSPAVRASPCKKRYKAERTDQESFDSNPYPHEAGDPHTQAAMRVFGLPEHEVDKFNHRLPAKTANFQILYGTSGQGLLDSFRTYGLNWTVDRCQELIDDILRKVYPGLDASIKAQQSLCRAQGGMIRDLYGMIRYLPEIYSESRRASSEAGRQAFSHVIQGTAQGMMQNAMASLRAPIRELVQCGFDVRWLLQIHDEVIFGFRPDLWPVMDEMVVEAMVERYGGTGTKAIKLSVPVEVEGHMAKSWASLK